MNRPPTTEFMRRHERAELHRVARALPLALTLTLYGAIGVLLLALLLGASIRLIRGGLEATVLRVILFGLVYALWLHLWRRLAVSLRMRICKTRAAKNENRG